MFPYIFVLWLVIFIVYLGNRSLKINFTLIPIFFLSLLAGLRDRYIGTDTWTYTVPFDKNYYIDFEINPDVEYGYQFLVYMIRILTSEYYWYLLIVAFFVIGLMIYSIKKYSTNYILSIYIYITFGFYTFLFNTVRQAIALAILFYGIKFFLEKKFIKYLILVFIASLFHVSAWIMIPFYFLIHFKIKLELKVLTTFLSSMILSSLVIQYLSTSNQRYEQYTQQSEAAGGYLLLLFYTIIAVFLYLFGKKLRNTNYNYAILEQLYFCGLVFVIPIAFLGTDPSGPQRVLYNFSVYLILLIPMIFHQKFDKLIYKFIFCIFAFIYFMMITYSLYGVYPYEINNIFRIF